MADEHERAARFRSDYEQHHAEARDLLTAENQAFILFVPQRNEDGALVSVRFIAALDLPMGQMAYMYDSAFEQLLVMRREIARTIRDAIREAEGRAEGEAEAEQ